MKQGMTGQSRFGLYCYFTQAIISISFSLRSSSPEANLLAAMDSFTTESIIIASPFPEEQVPVNAEDSGSSSTTKCVIA
ncbi:hypothetical protein BDY19DRAFT_991181 [Irpex rosettiformis]|uniref:Uncharacterized protein n=1 Tax=Irpex rosettiformis TaxID=378272 RepID=A0ACB8UAQ4_9APHY|nr:hypothetical protein BDY19DRAFT_991181 [Irpex rosettiformis]